ncbi:receptor protein kinase-like protein ZAR1 [Quercus lobata]|uniref:receptor protein kinase-like protein ZAR1 n=1 Tax=Quercus lobata TaxID=97700 RepID=UPI001248283B|nr:receptor protein kinase-like protein ZAR1 [Quercus lobata]
MGKAILSVSSLLRSSKEQQTTMTIVNVFCKVNCMYSRPYVREWGVVHLNILLTGYITEKVDVYIYGVLLLGLLAGWMLNTQYRYSPSFLPMLVNPCDEKNWLIEIIDPMLLKEGINQEHFLAFAQIALSCISDTAEDRPTIIDAGKQLSES